MISETRGLVQRVGDGLWAPTPIGRREAEKNLDPRGGIMSPELEILAIAVVTAVAAALPGTYLVLRRTAMVSDAISHAILPGIVVAFFLTQNLNSPLLLVAAAATGVLTVVLIEALIRSRLVPEDASIGDRLSGAFQHRCDPHLAARLGCPPRHRRGAAR